MTIRTRLHFLDELTFAEIPLPLLEVAFPSTSFCPDTVTDVQRVDLHQGSTIMLKPGKTDVRP
jgi:hypothetical protein